MIVNVSLIFKFAMLQLINTNQILKLVSPDPPTSPYASMVPILVIMAVTAIKQVIYN